MIEAIPFPKIEAVSFRPLGEQEYRKLKPFLDEQHWTLPYPEMSAVVVGEYVGKIVSFGVTHLVPHAEPLWVDPAWRGSGLAELTIRKLRELMESSGLSHWVTIAPSEFIARQCRAAGMIEIPGRLFVKE